MLPNSLTIVLPFISVSSTHPPVSVYGTGSKLHCLAAFLDNKVLLSSGLRLLTSLTSDGHLPPSSSADVRPPESTNRLDSLVVSPLRSTLRCRNINRLSIISPSRVRLRSRLTLIRLTLFRKPWVFGVNISIFIVVTYAYIFVSSRSSSTHIPPSRLTGMLPYR